MSSEEAFATNIVETPKLNASEGIQFGMAPSLPKKFKTTVIMHNVKRDITVSCEASV